MSPSSGQEKMDIGSNLGGNNPHTKLGGMSQLPTLLVPLLCSIWGVDRISKKYATNDKSTVSVDWIE